MSSAIHYRIFGQAVTLAIHSANSVAMLLAMQNAELMRDPDLRTMTSMQARYLTVWNIGFQIAYFSLALLCDVLTVTGRDHMIPKSLRRIRHGFFATVLWPTTAFVFCFFWPIFLWDREVLFPAFIDKMFSFKSNIAMHFYILPAALWEMVFLPRPVIKSHGLNVAIISAIFFGYNGFITHTYTERGLWPYPFLYQVYGTVYFPLFLAVTYAMGGGLYYLQWKITAAVWGRDKYSSKKIK